MQTAIRNIESYMLLCMLRTHKLYTQRNMMMHYFIPHATFLLSRTLITLTPTGMQHSAHLL